MEGGGSSETKGGSDDDHDVWTTYGLRGRSRVDDETFPRDTYHL